MQPEADGQPAFDVQCQDCGALLHLAPHQRTTTCFFCRSPSIVSRPGDPRRPTPRFALPFVLPPELAYARARRWQRSLNWFSSSELRHATITDLQPIYAPCFLYSAIAYSNYAVSIGEAYGDKSGFLTNDNADWLPLQGLHAAFVRDVVVSASRGLSNAELSQLEPYDLRALHRYTPALISGWPAEDPSVEPELMWALARDEARQDIARRLHQFMPGDGYHGLQFQTELRHEVLEPVLLPLWVLPVRLSHSGRPVRLLVNGQTGKVYGPKRVSEVRVMVVIFALGFLVLLEQVAERVYPFLVDLIRLVR